MRSLREFPQLGKPFCEACGAPTISRCQTCDWPIAGEGYAPFGGGGSYQPPKYCGECGKPHPWTEMALSAAREYADDLDQLSAEDKTILKGTFDDLASDTQRTPLAASRFRRIVSKISPVAGDALKQIIVTIATEAAKRHLG